MAHILLVEVPGGNDFSILDAAVRLGHQVSFFTADLSYYQRQQAIEKSSLRLAKVIIEIAPFNYDEFERQALALHQTDPFNGILCLIDTRMIETSRLATKLNLPFLNPTTATLMRDKFSVREKLAEHSIQQPAFKLATTNTELQQAVDQIGFPVLIKPSDGYGSQNITCVPSQEDLCPFIDLFSSYLPCKTDYGFGVVANDRLLVEQYIQGSVIGCDTFTQNGKHVFLGINEKIFNPIPSFAIKGGCFPSKNFDEEKIKQYVFKILDLLNFNCGAAHTEILVNDKGLFLVEINPRLVGAYIPLLIGYAFERSIHEDLVNLHLGSPIDSLTNANPAWFAVTRWVTTDQSGILDSIILPQQNDPHIRYVKLFKQPGDHVQPPFNNADRLACVMTVGNSQSEAEKLAENFIKDTDIIIKS
jgi:biotin carboxylase